MAGRADPERYRVLREKGTERPFSGALLNEHGSGVYRCAGCGAELFASDTKFESGTGWPSFYQPASDEAVDEETDRSFFMTRTEVNCATCGAPWATSSTTARGRRDCATSTTPPR